ncbi:hypothetical protein ASD11_04590 [Aeromicrobium sp. Root495]|uniref:helix-turn-helix transcriptional regulator n=1 Tax=Aeromicrobium sp. Root495 TaxID=1736550 RepID=UPI000700452E|nr:AAA family ATPase [Aeromicrobium sp. Root495]KQY58911.1 hypothetical protein ASD11_04590 [Aeromicrobium sp. Root495]
MSASTTAIVGRAAELDELATALGLGTGQPREAVLLGGDAGIGKTRVLLELTARAKASGFRLLVGHCLDLGDNAPSFQPFVQAFGTLDDETREAVGRAAGAETLLEPGRVGQDRSDVLLSVVRALEVLAGDQPVLMVVEDAHWADASTRQLLRLLLSHGFSAPVALAVSYRSDDLHRKHPLRLALAEWTRLPDVRRLELGPLPDRQVAELVQAREAGRMSGERVDDIVRRAAGNAFYAEELLEAGTGDAVPEELADVLLVRYDGLGQDARTVVAAAACAGGPVDDSVLAGVTGLDDALLHTALREAVDRRILVPVDDGYRFRHALLAEAVHDDLLPGERKRLHTRFLEVLLADDGAAAEISLHAHAAGRPDVAFDADVQAAADSTRIGGYHEAAVHLTRALEIVPPGHDVAGLVSDAADAYVKAGRLRTARALLEQHLEGPLSELDRARLVLALGEVVYYTSPEAEADLAAAHALRTVRAADAPQPLLARALTLAAAAASSLRRDDEALEHAEQALTIAEAADDAAIAVEAQTIINKIVARTDIDLEKPRQRYTELVESSRRRGDVHGELRGLHHLAFLQHNAGQLRGAEEAFREGMRRADETGRTWAPYGFDGRFFTALICYQTGRWDEVGELQVDDDPWATRLAVACMQAIGLLVSAGRGTPVPVEVADGIRSQWERDVAVAIHSGTALIELAPDLAAAEQVHDDLLETLARVWREDRGAVRIRMSSLMIDRMARAARTLPSADRASLVARGQSLHDEGVDAAERFPRLGLEGQAWLQRLRAELLRLRWAADQDAPALDLLVEAWRTALEAFDHYDEPYEQARTAVRLAEVLRAQGRDDESAALLARARAVAESLGAGPLLADVSEVAPSARVARAKVVALTPRELEVLALVAQGRSNGELARQLFISTKTASVHVSNILAKLGAASRTEAAAIAHRDGLLDT